MPKDWNLKEHRINEPDCEHCSHGNVYAEATLETFRLKLIKLFDEFCDKYSDDFHAWSRDMHNEATEVINNLYGMEE